jgi:hypothetical protein
MVTVRTAKGQAAREILDELVPSLFGECNVVLVDGHSEIRPPLLLNQR